MARALHKLNDAKVRAANKAGRISDGGGLYLRVSQSGSKSWSYMWNLGGNRSEYGLGPYPAVSLSLARSKASNCREAVAKGENPKALFEKTEERTFAECVQDFLEKNEKAWSNPKHRDQWKMTLGPAYCAKLQKKRPSEITKADVLAVLNPIWATKTETATRLRGRIERVLNANKPEAGWQGGDNPAAWRGNLETVLPKPSKLKDVKHHAAMPYRDVPAFVTQLAERPGLSARALELLIYTLCRTGEVLKAQWPEFDLDQRLWTIPKERMKTKTPHVVPLTDPAISILKDLYDKRRDEWVFPGNKRNKPLSNMVLEMLLRRMGQEVFTPHGFRSSFRDWAGDETEFAREVAEGCLAHTIGNEAEKAYRRGTAIKKRRNLLNAWANHCTGSAANVVKINEYAG
ncbi:MULTISPECIES: site-specific integrase [unclassified Labrenzia]|uniref:tyrosine-type recombinase/integrase n=1 Tax=unclassified Labrenzia TaxID=2648686 RepID=UPI0004B3F352|nr:MULTISPECIES: site-specific integrase [unclassified Labrenzia]